MTITAICEYSSKTLFLKKKLGVSQCIFYSKNTYHDIGYDINEAYHNTFYETYVFYGCCHILQNKAAYVQEEMNSQDLTKHSI